MTSRLLSLLVWAAVAASAVYWGTRLFVRGSPVPSTAVVAHLAMPGSGDLSRLLGAPPVRAVQAEAAAPTDARFQLVGVVAPRAGQNNGLALIAVDGKPARTVAVGRELETGLRLLSVGHRQVQLGAGHGAPALTLSLPALPEPNRGQPGEVNAGLPAVAVPGMPQGAMAGAQPGLPQALRQPGGRAGMGLPVPPQGQPRQAGAAQTMQPGDAVPEPAQEAANPALR